MASKHKKKDKKHKKPAPQVPAPVSVPAIPANFRRNNTGRQLIKDMMERLLPVDRELNSANPLFGQGDQLCKLSGCKDVSWQQVKSRAPSFFETKFYRARTPEVYGGLVYRDFEKILEDLRKAGPKRCLFVQLVRGICENTSAALV